MNITPQLTSPYLVVGGTGRTGRRVASKLAARGLPVRITSRRGNPPFDWHDDSTWDATLRGVRRAYVAFHPDIAAPGTEDLLGRFARRATEQGLQRLVLLSGRGEPVARDAEARVAEAVPECTVLRSSFFMQDFSEHFLLDGVRSGLIVMPAGATAEPFVDADDLADVAVHALTEDDVVGRTLELAGPELLTFAEAAAALSRATGRSISYRSCSVTEFTSGAADQGVPAPEARVLAEVFAQVFDGRNAHLTQDLVDTLGRPGRVFADYARRTAATGTWEESRVPAASGGSAPS
jgi:uncharacterized protein YbjT (DUF2867 family)